MNGREKLLDWERLWSNLTQEKIKRSTRDGSSSKEDEENCALESKAKKGKDKDSHAKLSSSMVGRSLKDRKCDAFIVMRWAILLQIVH